MSHCDVEKVTVALRPLGVLSPRPTPTIIRRGVPSSLEETWVSLAVPLRKMHSLFSRTGSDADPNEPTSQAADTGKGVWGDPCAACFRLAGSFFREERVHLSQRNCQRHLRFFERGGYTLPQPRETASILMWQLSHCVQRVPDSAAPCCGRELAPKRH